MTYKIGSINFTILTSPDIFPIWKIKYLANRKYQFIKERFYEASTKEIAIELWRNDFPDKNRYTLISIHVI